MKLFLIFFSSQLQQYRHLVPGDWFPLHHTPADAGPDWEPASLHRHGQFPGSGVVGRHV